MASLCNWSQNLYGKMVWHLSCAQMRGCGSAWRSGERDIRPRLPLSYFCFHWDMAQNVFKYKEKKKNVRKKKQKCGFLGRYDLAYARWDSANTGLNTFKRMTPHLIRNASNKLDKAAERGITEKRHF